MKLRTALSLSVLLAGTSIGLAQSAAPSVVPSQNSPGMFAPAEKPATFMDYMRAKQASHVQEVSGPVLSTGETGGVITDTGVPMTTAYGPTPNFQFYASGEYLLWRLSSNLDGDGDTNLPQIRPTVPYVFLSRSVVIPASDEPPGVTTNEMVNVYGLVNLRPVLFAGSNLDQNDRNGFRLRVGMNLSQDWALEASWFQLERRTADFFAVAAGQFEIANGLTDLQRQPADAEGVRPAPIAEPTVFSPLFTDQIYGRGSNQMWGLEFNARGYGYQIGNTRIEGLVGFRFVQFDESLYLEQVLSVQDPTYVGVDFFGQFIPSIENFTVLTNSMAARNRFYGPQVGVAAETTFFGFFLNGAAKLAVGGMHQEFNYFEDVFTLGATVPMPTNIYPYPTAFRESRMRLAWLPELTANVGYDFTDYFRGWVGYNVLWMQRVVRPSGTGFPASGDGTITNLGQSTAAPGPALSNFNETKIIAHGLNFGIELRY